MENLKELLGYAQSTAYFLLVITVLVFVHELGHYWFAKMFGMKVDAFAVMMGGLRQKGLEIHLKKPLISSKIVSALYMTSFFAMILSAMAKQTVIQTVLLATLAFIFPFWIATRIGALYRYDLVKSYKPILFSYIGGIVLIFLGTRFQNVSPTFVAALLFGSSTIGLLFLYYKPCGASTEESESMGFGSVDIDGEATEVRYRPLWWKEHKGTEFSMLLLPLGGFAKIRGMHPKEDGSEVNIEHGFYSKSAFARFMVLFAGPLFSILLGMVLFFATFAIYGEYKPSSLPIVGNVVEGKAADIAGLQQNDKIISIDGKPVNSFFDIVSTVRDHPDKKFSFLAERDGKQFVASVIPKLGEEESFVFGPNMEITGDMKRQALIGCTASEGKFYPLSLQASAQKALVQPFDAAKGFIKLFTSPSTAKNGVSGPAGIAKATHSASESGFGQILLLAAALSVSLGFMNLLPIHPLDGGQMVIAFIEMFRRERLSMKLQASYSTIGVSLLLLLMVAVWSQDIARSSNQKEVKIKAVSKPEK